ncbi:hypothetical protein RUM43_006346 [Polyplax serrata]|uniref:Transposase n=1 Tax=Polyplax serrata TaxID=468196 RepID=A0AAN8NRV7_POLSC
MRNEEWRKRLKQVEGEKRPNGKSRENWKRARNMFQNQTGDKLKLLVNEPLKEYLKLYLRTLQYLQKETTPGRKLIPCEGANDL